MVLIGAVPFAQPDDEHLEDAALEVAAEVGVRLDPCDRHESVGGEGVAVVPDRFAPAVGADLHGVHVGLHRHPEVGFVDLIMRQQIALAFGCGTAVGAHRRDDERFRAEFQQRIDGRLRQ